MADVLSFNLTNPEKEPKGFDRPDLSTKLKLLGVNVASFGDFFADRDGPRFLPGRRASKPETAASGKRNSIPPTKAPLVKALTYKDPFSAVYKKYLFTMDGKYLLGGMMIGDTNDYVKLNQMVKSQKELEVPPSQFILGTQNGGEENADDLYANIYSPSAPLLIISLQGRRHSGLLMPQCHQARRGRKS
jgi:nitrite reductase (NAD(P)H)